LSFWLCFISDIFIITLSYYDNIFDLFFSSYMIPFPTPTTQATMTDPRSDIEGNMDDDEDRPSDGDGEQARSRDSAAPSDGSGPRAQRPTKRRRKARLSRGSIYDPFFDKVVEDGDPGWKCRVCR
jgi:hypothetical protein